MTEKRLSIVITCHNQKDFIRDAVDSALAQKNAAREVIVVDDCSVDGSGDVLSGYGESIVLQILETNRGANEARNQGVSLAHGEYVAFLDGDDVLMPWALYVYEKVIADRYPKVIFSNSVWFKGAVPRDGQEPDRVEFVQYPNLMSKDRGIGMSASTLVVERQAFLDSGRWTPGIFELDLVDLCIKMGYSGRTILILSPAGAYYRVHAANSINTVPPFLRTAYGLITTVKALARGKCRLESYAYLGGILVFWMRRAFKAKLYRDNVKLAASGWLMMIAAAVRRLSFLMKGRRPIENLDLHRT